MLKLKAPKEITIYYDPHFNSELYNKYCFETVQLIQDIAFWAPYLDSIEIDFSHTTKMTAAAAVVLFAHFSHLQIKHDKPQLFYFKTDGCGIDRTELKVYLKAFKANNTNRLEALEIYNHPMQSGVEPHYKVISIRNFFDDLTTEFVTSPDIVSTISQIETGIKEALMNVIHHAYLGNKEKLEKRWWQMLWYSEKDKMINFIVYDVGVGIIDSFANFNEGNKTSMIMQNKAQILAQAFQEGSSRTGDIERGLGWSEILQPISSEKPISLWIATNNLIYTKGINQQIRQFEFPLGMLASLPIGQKNMIEGTLIEWSFPLTAR